MFPLPYLTGAQMSYSFFPADTDAELLILFFGLLSIHLLLIGGCLHGIKIKSRKWFWGCGVVLALMPAIMAIGSKLYKLL